MSGSSPTPDNCQPPRPPHNSPSSPDNIHTFPSSPPLAAAGYGDAEDFQYFGDGFSDAEEHNSSDEPQPDLPEHSSPNSPRPFTPRQLGHNAGLPVQDTQQPQPDAFCPINEYTQDEITQLINTGGWQSSPAEDLLRDYLNRRTVQEQQAAINEASTPAPQYPDPSATYVFNNGYEELSTPPEMLSGRGGSAPAPASNPFASSGPPRFDSRRNMFAELTRGTIYDTNINTAPVNQQPHEGYMPAPGDDVDDEASPEREEEESSEREDTPAANRLTRRNCSGGITYTPRARGHRRHPPRSDAHLRFSSTDPVAIADADHTHTIDRKHDSGRNLMGLFDGSDTPRTRYRLRIEGGRTGTHASSTHRASDLAIPARLALSEVCRGFPNHVWGTGLRLFMHEYIAADQIWKWLPDNVRINGCKSRPHNYLQQAIGRQCDLIMLEETGKTRDVIKRKHDDDEDEDEQEKKPVKKGKLTHTPGGHQILAPALSTNQPAFPQRSPTSPFAAQTQQGRAGPARGFQRTATNNTPLPGARAPSPDAPSPPRTAQDLRRLIVTERAMQDDVMGPRLQAQYGPMSQEDVQGRLRAWRFNVGNQLIGRVLRGINFAVSPLGNNDVVGLMRWFLERRPDARVPQAVPLANEDTESIALNWYLHMLREVTVMIGRNRVVVEGNDA